MAEVSVKLRIEGRVQAVWYRGWTVDQGQALGLRGWVRNRSDNTVEAMLTGPEEKVRAMIDLCWQGPPAARVDNVVEISAEDDGASGFRQLPTK